MARAAAPLAAALSILRGRLSPLWLAAILRRVGAPFILLLMLP